MVKFLMILALVPTLSFAQGGGADTKAGGGGIGIACFKGEELVSVELLDMYEARVKKLAQIELSGSFTEDAKKITQKIYKNTKELNKFFNIVSRYSPIPADSELTITNDALPAFLPRGCKVKQVANYYNDSTIYIDKTLFDKMDYLNQVALAFHEHIYAQERALNVTDSRYTRAIVGLAFSTQDPFAAIPKTGAESFLCSSADGKVSFNATQVKKEENIWKFSFLTLNGHKIFSPKVADFGINGLSPLGDFSASTTNRSANPNRVHAANLKSKLNDNEGMVIYSDSEVVTVSWVGTDPGDFNRDVKVSCQRI
jgi:hypothetical protein